MFHAFVGCATHVCYDIIDWFYYLTSDIVHSMWIGYYNYIRKRLPENHSKNVVGSIYLCVLYHLRLILKGLRAKASFVAKIPRVKTVSA